jgi:hypothetical protein
MKRFGSALVALVAGLLLVGGASAATTTLAYAPFGGAVGNTLTSDATTAYSGFDFAIPGGSIGGSQITNLSADYTVVEGTCTGGSPRYQLNTAGGNIFVYIGDYDSVTGLFNCAEGTNDSTGNLLADGAPRCDFSQLSGDYYGDCADVENYTITGIQLVVDAGWAGDQVFEMFPNVTVQLPDPTSKNQCKNGGYAAFGFENQGQCIKSVNTGQ